MTQRKIATNGLVLMKKPVQRVAGLHLVREASRGSVVLPRVWAVGEPVAPEVRQLKVVTCAQDAKVRPRPELAFYRKYTEAMLRRYLRLSMACGRVPSLLGRELFRGKVTNYKVSGFDDVCIFCMDVEKCLRKLQGTELELVKRIGVQQYTLDEAAGLLGMSVRGITLSYHRALDRLTGILLATGMLEAIKSIAREKAATVPVEDGPAEVGSAEDEPAIVENLVKGSEVSENAQPIDSEGEES